MGNTTKFIIILAIILLSLPCVTSAYEQGDIVPCSDFTRVVDHWREPEHPFFDQYKIVTINYVQIGGRSIKFDVSDKIYNNVTPDTYIVKTGNILVTSIWGFDWLFDNIYPKRPIRDNQVYNLKVVDDDMRNSCMVI